MSATSEMFPHYFGAGRPRESFEAGANWADVDAIIQTLNGKRSGSSAMVCCPAHDDSNPSLSINLEDGKMLVHCFGGYTQGDVIAALKARGLWKATSTAEYREKKRKVSRGDDWPVTAIYNYTDGAGNFLYEIRRHE